MSRPLRAIGLGTALFTAWLAAATAASLTVPELQRLLKASATTAVRFQEMRESPWLSAPAMSSGTMRSLPDALEKRVESPRRETWRLLADRIEWSGGGETRQIVFSQTPAVAPLADLMRRVVAGDFAALERDFSIRLTGDERVWSALLQPRTPEVKRYLDQVELQGTQGRLQVIIVLERNGERTTTRLAP